MTRILHRGRPVAILVAAVLLLAPTLAMAQTEGSDYVQGQEDGERDAKPNYAWAFAGCLSIFGFIFAATYDPSVPRGALLGKSAEYAAGYSEAYKSRSKTLQLTYAGIGCVVGSALWYALLVASADSSTP